MRVYVQWTKLNPEDWVELDVRNTGPFRKAWENLPAKPLPVGGESIDNAPGWITCLNVQGIEFTGADHYAVEPLVDGLRVTMWDDDPVDFPPGTRSARAWELRAPAADARFGGQLNTRQSLTVYDEATPSRWEGVTTTDGPVVVRPWSEFVPPATARHGIWIDEPLLDAHRAIRTSHDWREWIGV